ncbi:DUF1419 domain-containing protein [Aquibium oceanicum]|uniref:DUF1419 domain-containing protein n=1 Tax=Aquibium oceanicum TaxID=1670800 RepID=A0A1L3SZT1_9HYPH|nr:DUF1419 domain-containing protein [Aquibium oceanicum]APH74871.1 hypothetical protein BSQ44_25560 [Aquibium oceanicum]
MNAHPPFRKVLDGIASREQMFRLFDHHKDDPHFDPLSGKPYAGEWFEIEAAGYHLMLALLPPLFQRTGMFGMSEYRAGNVTSVFFSITIRGRERWFHGFCNLTDRHSPDAMRAAIIAHETGAADSMTREEKLEAIWNATHPDFRGIAGDTDSNAWPEDCYGKRKIVIGDRGAAVFKLLDHLTDEEIDARMPAVLARRTRRGGSNNADPS